MISALVAGLAGLCPAMTLFLTDAHAWPGVSLDQSQPLREGEQGRESGPPHRRDADPRGRAVERPDAISRSDPARAWRAAETVEVSAHGLQRYVSVLARWALDRLAQAKLEAPHQGAPGLTRLDDVVDVAPLRGHVRVGEAGRVLVHQLLPARGRVRGVGELTLVDDVHRRVRSHHCDLRGRPREVQVRAHLLGRHDAVRAAVVLARDDGQLRHGRLRVRVEQLRPVTDDPAVLLVAARQVARHVDEGDDRDPEGVAEADEARRLHRRIDVDRARQVLRLVAYDTHDVAAEAARADHCGLGDHATA